MNHYSIKEFSPENFPAPLPEKLKPKKIFVQYADESRLEILSKLPERGLAVVGPRNPSLRAESLIKSELIKLTKQDLIIVSGFARGVDAIAHEMSLEIGLPTIAILGCGLQVNYPTQNAELKKRILENGGLIISEFDLNSPANDYHFPMRNRLIAHWSKALWVVEAQRKSGTLNTAGWAREYDRMVYATPSFPGEIKNIGAQDLIDAKHAEPFWGIHSIGQSWFELATLRSHSAQKSDWDQPPLF
ncbi:MAG: DNA-protecting protein DprA [Xanthomonadaceae bacterium]|nr:DNA-protecting protein DprA [Xanthomonadaceae bacterium]